MQSKAATPDQYIEALPADRKEPVSLLRKIIKKNLPKGFKEVMGYGMIAYVVPHSLYAEGYHCDPRLPLPFMNLASQKNYISVYHMGIYAENPLGKWFASEYAKLQIGKPDMGKCCIRLKHMDKIPYALIGELATKMTPEEWIAIYEKSKPVKK
ncbi:MAG: DUF1801 domain-containing protein [Terrimonas sp.]|nr:DUF1801 domain-containing protein [Terrimonas sp.]